METKVIKELDLDYAPNLYLVKSKAYPGKAAIVEGKARGYKKSTMPQETPKPVEQVSQL